MPDLSIWNWKLTISPFWYLLFCALGTLLFQVVLSILGASAFNRGDFLDSEKEPGKGWTYRQVSFERIMGLGKSNAHVDFFVDVLIGFTDLAAYPILLRVGELPIIGAWLALRTAGNLIGGTISRTSFNRFLLTNILELALAYFWLSRYVWQIESS